jgi:hypothetical protein
MSTRSTISFMAKDGQIKLVYCHSDGYLSYNGMMLYTHYQDMGKVQKIMELGDMSCLNELVEPPEGVKHSYDNRDEQTTVFYGRDRGEDNVEARTYQDLDDYAKNGDFQEYDYLYKQSNNTWYLFNTNTAKLQKLETLLLKDSEIKSRPELMKNILKVKEQLQATQEKAKLDKVIKEVARCEDIVKL